MSFNRQLPSSTVALDYSDTHHHPPMTLPLTASHYFLMVASGVVFTGFIVGIGLLIYREKKKRMLEKEIRYLVCVFSYI